MSWYVPIQQSWAIFLHVCVNHFECCTYIYIYIFIYLPSRRNISYVNVRYYLFSQRKNKSKTFIWTAPKNVEECQRWLFTIFGFIMKICNDQWWTLMNCSNHNPTTIKYWAVTFHEIIENQLSFVFYYCFFILNGIQPCRQFNFCN